jgi:hypothetical protein
VNGTDFAILAANFGRTGRTFAQGDLTGDGRVDGSDFAILAGNFGKSVPPPAAPPAAFAADKPAVKADAGAPPLGAPTRRVLQKRPRRALPGAAGTERRQVRPADG